MKNKNNKLGIDIDYAIREFKKNQNEEYLNYLLSNLKDETILITIDKDCVPTFSEISEHSMPIINRDDRPTVIMTMDYKFWYSSFTKEIDIPEGFKNKCEIKKIKFKDLVVMCLESKDIAGISINHKSKYGVCINKSILEILDMF